MNIIRELSDVELDLVSGGKVYTSHVGGFTFKYDDQTRETTVGAGDVSVTNRVGSSGRVIEISTSAPA